MTTTTRPEEVDKVLAYIEGAVTECKDMFDDWPGNIELALGESPTRRGNAGVNDRRGTGPLTTSPSTWSF